MLRLSTVTQPVCFVAPPAHLKIMDLLWRHLAIFCARTWECCSPGSAEVLNVSGTESKFGEARTASGEEILEDRTLDRGRKERRQKTEISARRYISRQKCYMKMYLF